MQYLLLFEKPWLKLLADVFMYIFYDLFLIIFKFSNYWVYDESCSMKILSLIVVLVFLWN